MIKTVFLPAFRRDVQAALVWSEERFGAAAADRYADLIYTALFDLMNNPVRPGTKKMPELAPHAFMYHLMLSRDHVSSSQRVKTPRHYILYRWDNTQIEFARFLHDNSDLSGRGKLIYIR